MPSRTTSAIQLAILLTVGGWLAWVFVRYQLQLGGVQRHHVESAALAFVVVGLLIRVTRRGGAEPDLSSRATSSSKVWLAYLIAAFALYWPTIRIGLLSDDYVLVDRAVRWTLIGNNVEFIRPVPLSIWGALLNLGAGPSILHALNIAIHGTNAYLVSRVAAGWLGARTTGVMAGFLFLAFPLGPEAVAWSSAVFDLMATTFVLAAVLVSRTYVDSRSTKTTVAFFALAAAAMASKETAAVLPVLVMLDAWMCGRGSRRLIRAAAIVFAIAALVAAARLLIRFGGEPIAFNRFPFQRGIFQAFGALAVPFHVDLPHLMALSIAAGVLAIAVSAMLFLQRGSIRLLAGGLGWMFAAIVPVLPILIVDGNLQASRYLYLPSVAWVTFVVAGLTEAGHRPRLRPGPVVAAVILIAACAIATRVHQRHWREAAMLRDTIEIVARRTAALTACPNVTLRDLPDQVRGAYVFRNGTHEAFARDLGISAVTGDTPGPCAFRWDAQAGGFFVVGR